MHSKLHKIAILNLLLVAICFSSCRWIVLKKADREIERSRRAGLHITNIVFSDVETAPVPQKKNKDAADDPAIWIHPYNPEKSIVYGSDKNGGIALYDLAGNQLAYYEAGKINNIDIRHGIVWGSDTIDLLAGTNRSNHTILVAEILSGGRLSFFDTEHLKAGVKGEIYGFCLYHSRINGKLYAYLNSKAGEIEQWELAYGEEGRLAGTVVRTFDVKTQTEGMVANDKTATLYLGQELNGIWKVDAEPNPYNGKRIKNSGPQDNKNIKEDIEGLAIYYKSDTTGYLIASSQGNYSYAVFELEGENDYLCSFRIGDVTSGNFVDGVEETDGIEIFSGYLSSQFPAGVFIAQDGYNKDAEGKLLPQNFKYVDWTKIEKAINNPGCDLTGK